MGAENLFKEVTLTCDLKDEKAKGDKTEARTGLSRDETRGVVRVKVKGLGKQWELSYEV